jgi:uncharacterized tellurite resistance protein B-like protein
MENQPSRSLIEAHRLLAFIFFACADADREWRSEETALLYEFLEQRAGGLTREQSVAIAQEAYRSLAEVEGNEARLRVIEAKVPQTLAHLTAEERTGLLDDLLELVQTDAKVGRTEQSMLARIKRALLGEPRTDLPDLRLIACMCQMLGRIDGEYDAPELAKTRTILAARAPRATKRQIRETIEQAGEWYAAAQSDEVRLDRLEQEASALHWTLNTRERNDVLVDLMALASASHGPAIEEGAVVRAIRTSLVRTVKREELRLMSFIFFTIADADRSWTSEETAALYKLLEQHAGALMREEYVAIAQEAYRWIVDIEGTDARVAVIAEKAPHALAHLSPLERDELLDHTYALAKTDRRLARAETAVLEQIRQIVLAM